MKTFLRIIGAICCGFAAFGVGIVLAAIIYPTTDPPAWYGYALIIIPTLIFAFLLARAIQARKSSSGGEKAFASPKGPDAPLPPNEDHDGQTSFNPVADLLDVQDVLSTPDTYAEDSIDDDISPDDDFFEEDDIPHVEYPDFSGSFLHISGLPLLIGTFCKVSHFPDHLEIFSPKYKHYLATDRIADTAILSYKELKKLHSDLKKSAATSAAFMTLGEAIDISAKKKHLSPSTRFFLITYRDIEGEPQSIIFQLNDGNLQDAMKFTSGAATNIRPRIDL